MTPSTNIKPNIVFIFSDQQRWDTLGCYGQPQNITPNLDNMAEQGVQFDYAFSNQPVCGPARACIQTGRYPLEIGVFTNHRLLPIDEPTIAKLLSKAGYDTAYIGKWHLASFGPANGPNDFRTKAIPKERRGGYKDFWLAADVLEHTSHGYDGYMFDQEGNKRTFPQGRYRVDAQTDWVLEYLDQQAKKETPFFLFISYIEPHHQNDHKHYEGPKGSKERFKDFVVPGDLEGQDGDWQEEYPDYLGCINSLDENVGRIREKLDELGITDDTIVIYTSDHGSHFKTRNDEYKRSCHDGCIRIPMLFNGPGFKGGKHIENMVSLIDLAPSILRIADISPLDTMKGNAVQDIMEGKANEWAEDVFLQISESQVGRALRTKEWKYSVRAYHKNGGSDGDSDEYTEDYLYDLKNDPHERQNLVAKPAFKEVREMLRKRLIQRMIHAGEKEPVIKPVSLHSTN